MSYRFETNPETKKPEIVIDGWENGIAESPYLGIASMKNLNPWYLKGAVYSNYKRLLNSTTYGTGTFTVNTSPQTLTTTVSPLNGYDAFMVSSTGTLPAGLAANTVYFAMGTGGTSTGGTFGISLTAGGSQIIGMDAGTGVHTITLIAMGVPQYWTTDNNGTYYIIDNQGRVRVGTATTYFYLLKGNEAYRGTGRGIIYYRGYLFVFRTGTIDYYYNGTWTFGWKSTNSGTYNQAMIGDDDRVYFCDGHRVGLIGFGTAATFNPAGTINTDYTFTTTALTLPTNVVTTWISELGSNLTIAANTSIFTWDKISTLPNPTIIPIGEYISRTINIQNTLYILAGNKGNIYYTNGYSCSLFKRIPNYFFGVIDPIVYWGDAMFHRQKLYVGAFGYEQGAVSPRGIATMGVFSVDLDTGAINFENQSSFGLTLPVGFSVFPSNGICFRPGTTCLINLPNTVFDSYISAWYNGQADSSAGGGGIDGNSLNGSLSQTLYSNNEAEIQTDLIPVGTFTNPRTFSNIQFKLDRPMQSGDSIVVSGRQSLSDSWTQLGTTTTTVLSDFYSPLTLEKWQWLQLKVALNSGAAGQFVILREVRIA